MEVVRGERRYGSLPEIGRLSARCETVFVKSGRTTARGRSRGIGRSLLPVVLTTILLLVVVYVSVGLFRHFTARCSMNQGFGLSQAASAPGLASPVVAAQHQAVVGVAGVALPHTGWHLTSREGAAATIESDGYQLHAVRGTDGLWRVDSGYRC
jgi:hypothetical protein